MSRTLESFTVRARHVFALAHSEATRGGQRTLRAEHLLLALLADAECVANRVLRWTRVDLVELAAAVRAMLLAPMPEQEAVELGLPPSTRGAIEEAVSMARAFGHHRVGTGHLLFGVLSDGSSTAAQVLRARGVTLDRTWPALVALLDREDAPAVRRRPPSGRAALNFIRTRSPELATIHGVERTQIQVLVRRAEAFVRAPELAPSPHEDALFATFADETRATLRLAWDEAQGLQHGYIGSHHLLLGLLREGQGVAARALGTLGVKLDVVRGAVDGVVGRGKSPASMGGLTPGAGKALELAIDEARRRASDQVRTEHLLLGLMRGGRGIAPGILNSLGADLTAVREEIDLRIGPRLHEGSV